ncbi:MAG: RagB/SusD family nutrient uptake outer membrane protein, partial [Prevotella sp.]|nr:RagB/SusD family nutrient uptake outer membrane protein [Prevotella sp.]
MNKHIIPIIALLAGMSFTACTDQLDIEQKGTKPTSEFYKTDADCEKALATAYEGFMVNTLGRTTVANGPGIYTPARVLANDPGDDVLYGGGNYGDHEFGGAINQFRYESNPDAINFHYRGLYLSVYDDNLILDHFTNPATAFQKQAVAEARVLRAYNFFLLACYWGQPPFVDHLLDAQAIPTNSEMTQQQYYEWVAKECETAVPDLTERKSVDDKYGTYR